MRINLAKDPSLRSGTTAAYAPLSGTTLSVTEDYAFYGKNALLITKASVNGTGVEIAEPVRVVAGEPYAFSVYTRLPVEIPHAESAEIFMQVEWMNSFGMVVKTVASATIDMTSDDSWYRLGGVWNAPAGATLASVSIIQPLPGTYGASFLVDALLIEQSNYIGGYFDNIDQGKKNEIVNKALSAVPQVINGIRLGADVVLNNQVFNTIDEDDTVWVITGIDGWWGQADPEVPDIPRGTEDGSYDVEGRTKARTLSISGFFIPKDAEQSLTKALDRLTLATNLTRSGGWLLTHSEPTKAAWVRLSSKPSVNTINARGRTNFQINLRAGDPIKYHWDDADPEGFSTARFDSSDIPDRIDTNLFVYPSFETASASPVEIRRNLIKDPDLQTTAAWAMSATGTTATAPTNRFLITGTTAGAARLGVIQTLDANKPAGTYKLSVNMQANDASMVTARAILYDTAAVAVRASVSIPVTAGGGDARYDFTLTSTDVWNRVYIEFLGTSIPANASMYIARPMLELGTVGGTFWSPAVGPYNTDHAVVWAGTVNNSESILQATAPLGMNSSMPVGTKVYRSGKWARTGSYSLVVDPDGSSSTSYGSIILSGLEAGATYTAAALLRLEAPQTGSLHPTWNRQIMAQSTGMPVNNILSNRAPNEAGEHQVWVTFTLGASTQATIFFMNGSSKDKMWVDLATVVKGEYSGPPFDGTAGATNQPALFSWSGAQNASTSTRILFESDSLENIGTATVTGTFTLTGPAGAGTRIYNATTEQLMELAQPLRGAGLIADAYEVASTGGIATIKTDLPNHLRVGDEVALLNMVIPFSESDQTRIVTAVSDVFPYSFSVAIATDDIDPMPTSGQIRLVKNDVLVVDTYNRSVTFNGEISGHRSKLTTLTDWIKFAPGVNKIEFFDDVAETEVISKTLSGNIVTLETNDTHYLIPGEQIKVALPESKPLSKKRLAGNVVTLTTAEPHGFSVGDSVDVQSTESAKVVTKSRTSNVATLTTETPHGVAVSDQIVVALPATASPSQKELTSNVAKLTFQNAHGFSASDAVTVALPTVATITNKQLLNNQAVLTTSGAHTFAVGDQITVTMPSGASVVGKARNGSQIVITTATAHGFSVGDQVIVALPDARTPTGNFVADGVSNLITITTTAAHGYSVGDRILLTHTAADATRPVTTRSATTTACTLGVGTHSIQVGERITVTGVSARYNGSFYVTARTSSTVTYAKDGTTEASTATTGTVESKTVTDDLNGEKIVESTPSTTTFTIRAWDQNANMTRPIGTTTISNLTNASYNGTKSIISASGTTFAYNL